MSTQTLIDDLFRDGIPYAESLNSRLVQVLTSLGLSGAVAQDLFRDTTQYQASFYERLSQALELVGVPSSTTDDLFDVRKQYKPSLYDRLRQAFDEASPRVELSANSVAESAAINTVIGALSVAGSPSGASGWSFAITSQTPSGKLNISGTNLRVNAALDYETNTTLSVTITATKAAQADVVNTLTINITNVYEAANLSALALDDTDVPEDSSATINITGATGGSTITLLSGSLPTGMALAGTTITGTPTTPTSYSFTLRETLADSANSPRDTALSITVSAVGGEAPPTPVLTWTSDDTELDPTFFTTEIVEGDVAQQDVATDSGFTSIYGSDTNTIDAGEAASGSLTFSGIPTLLAGGTYFARIRYQRAGVWSDWSNTETMTMASGGSGDGSPIGLLLALTQATGGGGGGSAGEPLGLLLSLLKAA